MRFDKHFVVSMREAVKQYHTLDSEFDKFPEFYTVENPGRGSGYVNIGGQTGYWGVQYGPNGARRVTAYLYGLGAASGAWENMHDKDAERFTQIKTMTDRALRDLGQEEFDEWDSFGRSRVGRFHEWSAMGD